MLGGLNLTGLPEKDEHADAGGGGYRSAYYSSSSPSKGKIGGRSSSGSSSPLLEQRRAASEWVKDYSDNPNASPGKEWEWRGSSKGSWFNPSTGETLHPDLSHPNGIAPHYDYNFRGSGHTGWRIFLDGSIEKSEKVKNDV